jgi:hypothetical protein
MTASFIHLLVGSFLLLSLIIYNFHLFSFLSSKENGSFARSLRVIGIFEPSSNMGRAVCVPGHPLHAGSEGRVGPVRVAVVHVVHQISTVSA